MTTPARDATRADVFHDHLDGCEQCREHPFDLCPAGAALLISAGEAPSAPPPAPPSPPERAEIEALFDVLDRAYYAERCDSYEAARAALARKLDALAAEKMPPPPAGWTGHEAWFPLSIRGNAVAEAYHRQTQAFVAAQGDRMTALESRALAAERDRDQWRHIGHLAEKAVEHARSQRDAASSALETMRARVGALAKEWEEHAARIKWSEKCDALMTHAQDLRFLLRRSALASPSGTPATACGFGVTVGNFTTYCVHRQGHDGLHRFEIDGTNAFELAAREAARRVEALELLVARAAARVPELAAEIRRGAAPDATPEDAP